MLDDASDILVKEIKPNFKALGPRFGKNMKEAVTIINGLSEEEIKVLETNAPIEISIGGEKTQLEPTDVLIESKDIEGWLVANGNGLTVALDIQLDDTLIEEGIAREMINRIQNLRKNQGLEVTDKIILYLKEDALLKKVFETHQKYIQQETLTDKIVLLKELNEGEVIEFDHIKTEANLQKL